VYSAESLCANVTRMQADFAIREPLICCTVQANDNIAILRTFSIRSWF
jgi:hypothetical protein